MNLAGCFIKFGEFQHMLDFQQKGLLYCNPINYFTALEDNCLRGDDLENVVEMIYMESGEVQFGKPEEIPIKDGIKMPFHDAKLKSRIIEPFGNLFCLYKINLLDKPIGEIFTVDVRMKSFGECFLLIHDSHEFLKRVKSKLDQLKFVFDGNFVNYLHLSNYTGKKSVFQKDLKYEYQQEYRIFIKNKTSDPIIIDIGNIEDISILCESIHLEKLKIAGSKKDETTFTVLSNLERQDQPIKIAL